MRDLPHNTNLDKNLDDKESQSRKQGRKQRNTVFGTKQIAIEIAIEEPFGIRDDFYVSKDCIKGGFSLHLLIIALVSLTQLLVVI